MFETGSKTAVPHRDQNTVCYRDLCHDVSVRNDHETIYKRDRKKHASPNSAQTEAVCAGALSIRLAGDASYFGKTVKKPYIGEAVREVEYEDIKRANHLMYITAWLCEILCLLVMLLISR